MKRILLLLASALILFITGNNVMAQPSLTLNSDCVGATLSFSESGIDWPDNTMNNSYSFTDLDFDITINDADGIFVDSEENGDGLQIGIDPSTTTESLSINYAFSSSVNYVHFKISDIDYKNGGAGLSNQQEAVTVIGYFGGDPVMPVLQSVEGSVSINGNVAEATANSAVSGDEESISVLFDECVDHVTIIYGTGTNSPVADPTYSKINIGMGYGFTAQNCGNACDTSCVSDILNFTDDGVVWNDNDLTGIFDYPNIDFEILTDDSDEIFEDSEEDGAGVQFGIDPSNTGDVFSITYIFSETVNFVEFAIKDLDYKNYGANSSNQQEAVTITGQLGDDTNPTIILPLITSIEGSVSISGNYAEGTTDSAVSGDDESILVTFTECIDRLTIVYGTGNNSPVPDPTYSKITVGDDFGMIAKICDPGCIFTGCTDSLACNYDPNANTDDGSCDLSMGCTDPMACNYDADVCLDDGSCDYGIASCTDPCNPVDGCTDPMACNFDDLACVDDGSCELIMGCTDPDACNFDPAACIPDGSLCDYGNPACDDPCNPVMGCTDDMACNYDPAACVDDNSCDLTPGCTDDTACNYDPAACVLDSSCDYGNPACDDPCNPLMGCTDDMACNYDPAACVDDNSCDLTPGCTDDTACNYDPAACVLDTSCDYGNPACDDPCNPLMGCTDDMACNYDPAACVDDNSCDLTPGCTDDTACNYDPAACVLDTSCDYGNPACDDPCYPVMGCTDDMACNYDPAACIDDNSCDLTPGCTDDTACNYDPAACVLDTSCDYGNPACDDPCNPVIGCTDDKACNYDPAACIQDSSCDYGNSLCDDPCNPVTGCTDPDACNYDPTACIADGSCDLTPGCTDDTACNYDPAACVLDTSCDYGNPACDDPCNPVMGCTNPDACNYDPAACVDNGMCDLGNPTCPDPCNELEGCTNAIACNYDALACIDDGSCNVSEGCIDPLACNYDDSACFDNGSCYYPGDVCDDNDPATDIDLYDDNCDCTGTTSCVEETLKFNDPGIEWADNDMSGFFSYPNRNFEIQTNDPDNIFVDSEENGAGLQFGIDPSNTTETLGITYIFSEVVNFVEFKIKDIDYKNYGPNSSNQQEAVTIYGMIGPGPAATMVLPVITSLSGSVSINGNYAEGTEDSAVSGDDESILVTFDDCIDRVIILYGTGNDSPVADPTYSKIKIGTGFGMITENCFPGCEIFGCTDMDACNYDPYATTDDGSCDLGNPTCPDPCNQVAGCTNQLACNYDPIACFEDGSCDLSEGCTDPTACNYDADACINIGTLCDYGNPACDDPCNPIMGCTNDAACNYDPAACVEDGSCDLTPGCTDDTACNYDPTACVLDTSCDYGNPACDDPCNPVMGCTNPDACNYDPAACVDNGMCDLGNQTCPDPCNELAGCTNALACNYDALACIDDGSCNVSEGCIDPLACNYDDSACFDNGSCYYPGDACDDNDPATDIDLYDDNCDCTGTTSCVEETLKFNDPGIEWADNDMSGFFSYPNRNFEIQTNDPDNIFVDSEENGAGLQFGIDPSNTTETLGITYIFSEVVNFVEFKIKDIDYKNYGPNSSNQQEAVTIYGMIGPGPAATMVLPVITSLSGSVSINGNYAEGTEDSAVSGDDESILVTFDDCIDRVIILYGTGNDSPVADPTYSKIKIGTGFGMITENCFPGCEIFGCTDMDACNYDPYATTDDGSCDLGNPTCPDPCNQVAGCTNQLACNYDPIACFEDGSCDLSEGCTDPTACNYDADACINLGTLCDYGNPACDDPCNPIMGCTNDAACNYDPAACVEDGSCDLTPGCTDDTACNYDPAACVLDTSCDYGNPACDDPCNPVMGCTNPDACNYDPAACVDNGMCDLGNQTCPDPCNELPGCTNALACNYDALACIDDGSCNISEGCTDPLACNFDDSACFDNGSCYYPGDVCDDNDPATDVDVYDEYCECTGSTTCVDETLDFTDPGIDWNNNDMSGSFSYPNRDFDIQTTDPDNIFVDSQEYGEGVQFGIDPSNTSETLVITYTFSEIVNFVEFKIKDLDYKNYGMNSSNQQEAVTIYGMIGDDTNPFIVLPLIVSLDGSVDINGNYAEGTTDSFLSGQEESILVTFTECIDRVIIVYGTGNNSPVTDPTYSKIQIGTEFGMITENCYPYCNPVVVMGCVEIDACNYDPNANQDDGSCFFVGDYCDDLNTATIYDVYNANCDCEGIQPVAGCTDPNACNYNSNANIENGSCYFIGDVCDDQDILTINDVINDDCDCVGVPQLSGCTMADACNFNPDANVSDSSCFYIGDPCDDLNTATIDDVINSDCDCEGVQPIPGCTDMDACNFDAMATVDNFSCLYIGDPCDDMDTSTPFDSIGVDCLCVGGMVDLTGGNQNGGVTGIEDEILELISIYPNPADNFVIIDLADFYNDVNYIKLLNINGQVVKYNSNLDDNSDIIEMDIKDLQAGIYFVEINTDFGNISKRLQIVD